MMRFWFPISKSLSKNSSRIPFVRIKQVTNLPQVAETASKSTNSILRNSFPMISLGKAFYSTNEGANEGPSQDENYRIQRKLNEVFYYQNRYKFLKDPGSRYVVVILNQQVAGFYKDFPAAEKFLAERSVTNPDDQITAFVTWIGHERYRPVPIPVSVNRDHREVLVHEEDEPPVLFFPLVRETEYKPKAFFYGARKRPYVTLPLKPFQTCQKVAPVLFLMDTGSPKSFITKETAKMLGIKLKDALEEGPEVYQMWLYQAYHLFPESSDHFKFINLLGTDLMFEGFTQMLKFPTHLHLTESVPSGLPPNSVLPGIPPNLSHIDYPATEFAQFPSYKPQLEEPRIYPENFKVKW